MLTSEGNEDFKENFLAFPLEKKTHGVSAEDRLKSTFYH